MRNLVSRKWSALALILIAVLLLSVTMTGAAQTPKALVIGVIGSVDSATARGAALAESRFNARGNTVTPDGVAYRLSILTQDANNPGEVATAIANLKKANAVAIFGPDRDDLAVGSANSLLGAGVPVFTSATSNAVATAGTLFRTRADDSRMMNALAEYLVTDLAKGKIAIFQGDPGTAQQVTLFATALGQLGKTPATTVLQVAGGALKDSARVLIGAQPDAVVAFGANEQVASLLRELRGQGYNGPLAYPDAQDRPFIRALPPELRSGIIGVTNWSYSLTTAVTGELVRDYVSLFGEVPTAQSAAAYDAAGAVIITATRAGIAPEALTRGILALPKVESIQGHFNAGLGGNELSADVSVFTTGDYGAPVVVARFDETGRLTVSGVAPTLVPAVPPTQPPPPTQEGTFATPKNATLNVRRGPGLNYDIMGKLKKGESVQVIGMNQDGSWLVISFAQQQGWISTSLADVSGSLTGIPFIEPPPSPTPLPATFTPSPQPFPDLVALSAVFNPPQPKSGQPFTVSVVVRNQGVVDAGHFAVAASFLPGNVYTAQIIPGLAAGQATTVNLTATVTGPGTYTVAIVVDLNKEVNEGSGEANNDFPVTYTVVP